MHMLSVYFFTQGSSRGKQAISPVPSAAHARNMRKGSADHLALDISTESDNLISRVDTDEDKGNYELLIIVNFLI